MKNVQIYINITLKELHYHPGNMLKSLKLLVVTLILANSSVCFTILRVLPVAVTGSPNLLCCILYCLEKEATKFGLHSNANKNKIILAGIGDSRLGSILMSFFSLPKNNCNFQWSKLSSH